METKNNKTIDLPKLVDTGINSIETGTARLEIALKSIARMTETIIDLSGELLPSVTGENDEETVRNQSDVQRILHTAMEMELMIEKTQSLVKDIYTPALQGLVNTDLFISCS